MHTLLPSIFSIWLGVWKWLTGKSRTAKDNLAMDTHGQIQTHLISHAGFGTGKIPEGCALILGIPVSHQNCIISLKTLD